ncbi:Zn(2)-C6 fungal-type DNA-binding domain protein [Metarhizium album ARSEF 1941]|uniref:Zn(2)-C6 fungal-type DNA-binding domain protein n=1 Tax=Metarhizium album (strain ARSEF 1941) TaxID=1081103 RepID=A0A0B2WQ23_METAS|nr:Zn(2)-C6 fungal-type DNA-binding domain protein [Metarhizium album ARSEF 1941]KHN95724.1 Zn(2)-C6 fungal-type DNA-binding domain protein [Metarhizium album ARSEF 1941]
MGRQWRQRPIACRSCRRRKIRCSRQFPCSNCTSRGVQCLQFYEPLGLVPEVKANNEPKPPNATDADIRARLDRLETWITGIHNPDLRLTPSVAKPDDAPHSSASASASASFSPHAELLSPPSSSTVQHLSADALWFGGNFLYKTATCIPPLSPIRLIKKPYSVIHDATSALGSLATSGRVICLTLPLYREACIILRTFIDERAILCPMFHVPYALQSMQSVYTSARQRMPADTSHLLLFLAIIASVTYASSSESDVCQFFASHLEANAQCASWVAASYALSDEIKERGQASMICLQGQNILYKVSAYMEASSIRTRSLISTSIAMARDLGLHRIDGPGKKPSSLGLDLEMDIEIGRRLWWDLASIDWLLAFLPGSHAGMYAIHPQHMAVNKPRIVRGDNHGAASPEERDEQSDLSCFLERIRLAEISRQHVDVCPLSKTKTKADYYQEVVRHDARLKQYQRELPPFFSIDRFSTPPSHEDPTIVIHRIHLHCVVYILRCFLHLQYLPLSSIGARYTPSRTACLACASDIVRLHRQIKSQYSWIIPRLKATNFLKCLVMASAVFLLDVCSGTEIRDFKSERSDMLDAWELMSDQQEDSNHNEQFFEFASQMFSKYGVSKAIVADLAARRPTHLDTTRRVPGPPQDFEQAYPAGRGGEMGTEMMDMAQRWQMLDADFDLKAMGWDNVLSGFDAILM